MVEQIQLVSTPEDLASSMQDLARIVDPEYRDAELDLQAELLRLGVNADEIMIPLSTVLAHLVWIAYRAGYQLSKQN